MPPAAETRKGGVRAGKLWGAAIPPPAYPLVEQPVDVVTRGRFARLSKAVFADDGITLKQVCGVRLRLFRRVPPVGETYHVVSHRHGVVREMRVKLILGDDGSYQPPELLLRR